MPSLKFIQRLSDPDKLLGRSLMAAAVVSVLTASTAFDWLTSSDCVLQFASAVGFVFPAVNSIALHTNYVSAARVTLACQWLFAPVYFLLFCAQLPPWKVKKLNISQKERRRRAFAVFPAFALMLYMALGDWGIGLFPSMFSGSIWDPTIGISSLPYNGRLGLAVCAFLSPFMEALIYWLLPLILTNLIFPVFIP